MNPFASKNLNITLSAVAIVVLLAGVYWYFFAGVSAASSPLTQSAILIGNPSLSSLTSRLDSVTFDTAIFSDPRFASLKDISTPVNPEPKGKKDPFAPL
jgi:hypothetical protein